MSRFVLVAPLQSGAAHRARALIAAGPPFDLARTRFDRYHVFLTEHEAIFVFEGSGTAATPDLAVADLGLWTASSGWADCLAEPPRLAAIAFAWEGVSQPDGIFFGPTPGPGDSEGGDLY